MTRREWCYVVAKLVSPSFPEDATKALCDMLPALQNLPDALFSDASALAVAGCKRRQSVPAWDEITNTLGEFRRTFVIEPARRLAPPAPLQDRDAPGEAEVARVAELVREAKAALCAGGREREALFPSRVSDGKPLPDVTLKGEALHRSRQARGCNVPVPGYTPRAAGPVRTNREVEEADT